MEDAADFKRVRKGVNKEDAVVTDAKAKLIPVLKSFYVALAGLREAMQSGENAHCNGLIHAADVSFCRCRPGMRFTYVL